MKHQELEQAHAGTLDDLPDAFAADITGGIDSFELYGQVRWMAHQLVRAASRDDGLDLDGLRAVAEGLLPFLDLLDIEAALLFAERYGTIFRHFREERIRRFDDVHRCALAALDEAMLVAVAPLIRQLASADDGSG